MEPFALDKPTITLHGLRLIECLPPHTSTAIFPHILTISPLLTVCKIYFMRVTIKISQKYATEWPSIIHFFVLVIFKSCSESASMFVFVQLQICSWVASVVNSIYCNKAAEPYNRPPLKSTNKSLFPWLAPAWLGCGVNIEFPNDGPCRL